jgi:hypothetical protein
MRVGFTCQYDRCFTRSGALAASGDKRALAARPAFEAGQDYRVGAGRDVVGGGALLRHAIDAGQDHAADADRLVAFAAQHQRAGAFGEIAGAAQHAGLRRRADLAGSVFSAADKRVDRVHRVAAADHDVAVARHRVTAAAHQIAAAGDRVERLRADRHIAARVGAARDANVGGNRQLRAIAVDESERRENALDLGQPLQQLVHCGRRLLRAGRRRGAATSATKRLISHLVEQVVVEKV